MLFPLPALVLRCSIRHLRAQAGNEPLHQRHPVEGGHQVKAVRIGRSRLSCLHRDFQSKLLTCGAVQPLKLLDDGLVHMDAVDLVFHKDGVALAHHRQDAGQDLCLRAKGLPGLLQVLHGLLRQHRLAAVVEEGGGLHKELKTKFIEGDASFMSLVAIALVLGLAFCIERIIYLSLAETNTKKLMANIEAALEKGDVEAAKTVCRNTRGPVASICYQGLMRIDEGIDVVERSVVSYGGVQAGYLEKGCSWITLFIAMAPSLGFLGTVIGMVQAFDKIQQVGDISPTVVAGGMKVALITTIFGLIVALILQVFYNYVLSKIEALTSEMEDSSISLLDMVIKYNLKYKK